MKKEPTIEEVREALYVEDCHVTGMHDPTHTPHRVCEKQLTDMAMRVLKVFGVDIEGGSSAIDETNKITRRLNRDGFYKHCSPQKQKALRLWEKHGVKPR